MLFIVKFGKELSEVDMLSTVVLDALISVLLERSYIIMQFAYSINSEVMRIYGKMFNIIRKNIVVYIYIYIYIYLTVYKNIYI